MKRTLKKEIITAVSTAFIITMFSVSIWILPPLGNLLNPNGDFWNATKGPHEHPTYEEVIYPSLAGMNVTVYRDEYGVPHIYAQNYTDLFFAYGYCMAQDRFFEMTLMKLIGWGRLSEVIGSLGIDLDKYLRTLGLWKAGEDLIKVAEKNQEKYLHVYQVLEFYCKGVNEWVDTHRQDLPIEFSILALPVEHWEMVDSAVFAALAELLLSWTTTDLAMEEVWNTLGPWLADSAQESKYGSNALNEIFPDWNASYPYETPVLPDNHSMGLNPAGGDDDSLDGTSSTVIATLRAFLEFDENCRSLLSFGTEEDSIGSNNWVINGSLSNTGMPILCGDPHLMYMTPSIWYECHLVCPSTTYVGYTDPKTGETFGYQDGYNSYGIGFPGTPIVLIGHNEHCAWSQTVVGSDTFVDFYEETLNDEGTEYYFNGSWRALTIRDSPIKVKNGPFMMEEPFSVRFTCHGPIMTDAMSGSEGANLSVKWIALQTNTSDYNVLIGYDLINRAQNITGMKFALDNYPGPPMNFAVADDQGNIGMICAGLYPIRAKNGVVSANYTGRFIQPGDGTGEEWVGYIQPEHLPHCINPVNQSYLASANQRTIAAEIYNYSIGHQWANEYRARSINRYLNTSNPDSPYYGKKISVDDMKDIQYSSFDVGAQSYVPIILDIFDNLPDKGGYSSDFNASIEILREWNNSPNYHYQMEKHLVAPTIFDKWMDLLPNNVWGDEWTLAGTSSRYPEPEILEFLVREGSESNWWFDNVSTTSVQENKTDIILRTLVEAVTTLSAEYGSLSLTPQNWIWGDQHKFGTIGIPLIFNALFNRRVDTIPIPGSARSLNNAPKYDIAMDLGPIHIDLTDIVFSGPSWRQIIDFSAIEQSVGILPGGESENIASKHYFDQAPLWAAGNYKQLLFFASPQTFVRSHIESTLIFRRV